MMATVHRSLAPVLKIDYLKTSIVHFQGDKSGYKHRTEVGNAQNPKIGQPKRQRRKGPNSFSLSLSLHLRCVKGARLAPIQSRKLSVTKLSAKKAGMTFLPLPCHFGSLVPFRAMAIECQNAMERLQFPFKLWV